MKRGIDISKHQGYIDFDEVKKNYDFVMIRVAMGDDLSEDDSECSQCDKLAQHNIEECELRDIPYGLYIYSYALSDNEARSEAKHILEWYYKCNAKLGLWLDMEDADYYKAKHGFDYNYSQNIALIFAEELGDAVKGIYASHSWLTSFMDIDELRNNGMHIWEAHWNDDNKICDNRFDLSQESSDYYLPDGTRVDYDIMNDDFFDYLVNDKRSWSRELAERVTQGLYSNLLFRDYTDGENEAIVNGLEYDMSRWQAFLEIYNSEECQKKLQIVAMYLVMRGEIPSREEVNVWFNADDIFEILYSDEFNNKYNI